MTKKGSKKSQRVFSKSAEGAGLKKKGKKGKGKEKEGGRKWKRDDEEEEDEEDAEDGVLEMEANWWSFVTTRMVTMSLAVEKLQAENEMLWEEVRDMRQENTEDRRDFIREVREVQKDTRMMEAWMRKIVEWIMEKESEERLEARSETESETEMEDRETGHGEESEKKETQEEEMGMGTEKGKELESEGNKGMEVVIGVKKETEVMEVEMEVEKRSEEKGAIWSRKYKSNIVLF